jgi:two-component system CheB/CheR fusion protein
VLSRLHFALNDSGYLFLGKAEMLLTHTDLFLPVNMKFRVFRRIPGNPGLERRALLAAQPVAEMPRAPGDRETRLRELAFEAAPVAQVLLDAAGNVITGNLHARKIFGLRDRDMGRPFHELEVSYRPVDLGSLIQSAISQRRTLSLNNVERLVPGESAIQYLDLQVVPMLDDASIIGVSILFNDVTDHVRLQSDLEHSKADLESAYEEVQSSHEELETTNEELQSSNEELETTNEELQSANEELETMNEELNSTNEELQTMNDELRQRTQELDQSNAFLGAVVASLGEAVIVVDPKLRILIWNQRSEDLWGLRSEEVTGRPLMDLEIGLPLTPVKALVDDCLTGRSNHARAVLDATNRRGKSVRCSVICAPLVGQRSERVGVILSMAETKA